MKVELRYVGDYLNQDPLIVEIPDDTKADYRFRIAVETAKNQKAGLNAIDLSHFDLSGMDLSYTSFIAADLSRANLTGANISGSNFEEAILCNADLRGVHGLDSVNLIRANITGAIISLANRSAKLA